MRTWEKIALAASVVWVLMCVGLIGYGEGVRWHNDHIKPEPVKFYWI